MVSFQLRRAGVWVVCLWALVPGAVLAPFLFWQSPLLGGLFCLFWLAACLWALPRRLFSLSGTANLGEVRITAGVLFKSSRRLLTHRVSAVSRLTTPLLRLCGCCVLVLVTSGALVVLPGLANEDADRLAALLGGD